MAAAALAAVPSAPAAAQPFPVTARLLGGPPAYTAGAAPRELRVELENTSRDPLRDVHPVLVFVDRGRALAAEQIRLEYRAPAPVAGAGSTPDRVWRPVAVEHTDNDENIAVVGGEDGPGTTLPPGRKVAIALRLRFTAAAPAGPVTASATVMERRGRDGDWVGESAGYDFDVLPSPDAAAGPRPSDPGRTGEEGRPNGGDGAGSDGDTGTGPGAGPGPGPGAGAEPEAGRGPRPGTGAAPGAGGKDDGTGPGSLPGLAATGDQHRAPALVLTGAGVLMVMGGAALRFCRRG